MSEPRNDLPSALLWDLDGTLVDTEGFWMQAEHDLVAAAGGQWTQELAHQVVGFDLLDGARVIRENSPVTASPEQIVDHLLADVIAALRQRVPWRPGAVELLTQARAAGVRTALVTMSWRSLAQVVIEALPPHTFDVVVTGDEVERGKPHPDPYLRAVDLLGLTPQECLAIEDSPTGVRAAVAAGVPTVAVPNLVSVPDLLDSVHLDTLAGVDLGDLPALARAASVDGVQSVGRR